MNIYEKLMNIQTELKAPKSQYNRFGKYNYRNCEDILEAFKQLGLKHGAALTVSDKIVLIGDRYYVEATAKLIDVESCASLENTAYAREEDEKKGMDSSQVTGSTSSYARKYALNGLFAIDDTKDSDTTNTGGENESIQDKMKHENKPTNAPKTSEKVKLFEPLTKSEMVEKYGVSCPEKTVVWLEGKFGKEIRNFT